MINFSLNKCWRLIPTGSKGRDCKKATDYQSLSSFFTILRS